MQNRLDGQIPRAVISGNWLLVTSLRDPSKFALLVVGGWALRLPEVSSNLNYSLVYIYNFSSLKKALMPHRSRTGWKHKRSVYPSVRRVQTKVIFNNQCTADKIRRAQAMSCGLTSEQSESTMSLKEVLLVTSTTWLHASCFL